MARPKRPTTSLFKSYGALWSVARNMSGDYRIDRAHCPNETCHAVLTRSSSPYNRTAVLYCTNCKKRHTLDMTFDDLVADVQRRFEGWLTLDYPIESLDPPPTAVSAKGEDDNYWVKIRLTERQGKRMAVVYIGEKLQEQTQQDYAQLFFDAEDDLVRFDKNNKNPMKLLAKLTAEFPDSTVTIERRSQNR
jgi:hypothetical protein